MRSTYVLKFNYVAPYGVEKDCKHEKELSYTKEPDNTESFYLSHALGGSYAGGPREINFQNQAQRTEFEKCFRSKDALGVLKILKTLPITYDLNRIIEFFEQAAKHKLELTEEVVKAEVKSVFSSSPHSFTQTMAKNNKPPVTTDVTKKLPTVKNSVG